MSICIVPVRVPVWTLTTLAKRVREFAHTEIKSPNKTLFKTYACAIYSYLCCAK